jgi:hypothetical protein
VGTLWKIAFPGSGTNVDAIDQNAYRIASRARDVNRNVPDARPLRGSVLADVRGARSGRRLCIGTPRHHRDDDREERRKTSQDAANQDVRPRY